MPVYNNERYLHAAIDSILRQTLKDLELVLLDDGSTDNSIDVVRTFRDPRIKLICLEHRGLPRVLNFGIQNAEGEYIARMDGDDIAIDTRLEKQVSFLNANPDVGIVGTYFHEIDEAGQVRATWVLPTDHESICKAMIKHSALAHPTVMMRRVVLETVGFYNEKLLGAEDYDLWIRISRSYRLANIPEPLLLWRVHESGFTSRTQRMLLLHGLNVRFRAIRDGTYPLWSLIHLVGPVAMWLLPPQARARLRRFRSRSGVVVLK